MHKGIEITCSQDEHHAWKVLMLVHFYIIDWCCHVQLFDDYSVSYVLIQILQCTAMTTLPCLIQDANPKWQPRCWDVQLLQFLPIIISKVAGMPPKTPQKNPRSSAGDGLSYHLDEAKSMAFSSSVGPRACLIGKVGTEYWRCVMRSISSGRIR